MTGQTTVMVNGLNLGNLAAPGSAGTDSWSRGRCHRGVGGGYRQEAIARAYYRLGEALKAKGMNNKAAAAYKKALELQPNFPDALKALAAMK